MKKLMFVLFCISSSTALAQQKLPAGTPDPNRSETAQTVKDFCSQKNIMANMNIATALFTLYGNKKAADVQFDNTVWEWAESTDALLGSCGSIDDVKQGAILARAEALEIERLFLLSVFVSLSEENRTLRAQVQQLSAHTQVAARAEAEAQRASADAQAEARRAAADSRRALALAILSGLGQSKPYQVQVPPPLQFPAPLQVLKPATHCVTRYIGQTAYTDCQ